MIGSVFFIFNRLVEITFLIPIIGMLVCSSTFSTRPMIGEQTFLRAPANTHISKSRPTSSTATLKQTS